MAIYFENITKDTLYIALEMINSNPDFNILENGKATLTLAEMEEEFLHSETESRFIKDDDTYIGILDYLLVHPNDGCPWLGLLLIHGDYQGYGYGTQVYTLFERELLEWSKKCVRIGVIKENSKAHTFWKHQGFTDYKTVIAQAGYEIVCYEKNL